MSGDGPTDGRPQVLIDFLALIAMQQQCVFDDLRLMDIRERVEGREAKRRDP